MIWASDFPDAFWASYHALAVSRTKGQYVEDWEIVFEPYRASLYGTWTQPETSPLARKRPLDCLR